MKLHDALYAEGSWARYGAGGGGGYHCCYKEVGENCYLVRQFKGPFHFEDEAFNTRMNEIDGMYEFSRYGPTIEVLFEKFWMLKLLERHVKSKYAIDINEGWYPGSNGIL